MLFYYPVNFKDERQIRNYFYDGIQQEMINTYYGEQQL
jgi:hypothetical protein